MQNGTGDRIQKLFPTIAQTAEFIDVEHEYSWITDFIDAQGFEYLGSGIAGTVYGRSDADYVYKRFDLEDYGYMIYLEFALKNQHMSTVPTIYGVRIFSRHVLVCMERLEDSAEVQRKISERDGVCDALHSLSRNRKLRKEEKSNFRAKELKELPKLFKGLQKARKEFELATDDFAPDWDLHDGNYMFRGKQLVLTDPMH